MKWMAMIPLVFFLSGCCCTGSSIEYRQVLVVQPYRTFTIVNDEPVDVTTTTVHYW